MMKADRFWTISLRGRIAYGILCAENYAKAVYPDRDWSPLFRVLWAITNSQTWDKWADKYIELIPEYLFEFPSFEASNFQYLTNDEYFNFIKLQGNTSPGWNAILKKIYEIEEIYAYSTISGYGQESISILDGIIGILNEAEIQVPAIENVMFSHFSECDGWGTPFDGAKLSTIIDMHN